MARTEHHPKDRLIIAAADVLAARGFEAATIKEIAHVAEVNQGLVHYYFGTKDALLLAVLERASDLMGDAMRHIRTTNEHDQVSSAALALVRDRVRQAPNSYRLSYELYALGLRNPALLPGVQRLLGNVRDGIATTLQTIRRADGQTPPDVHSLAAILLACFDGLALQALADPTFDLDRAYLTLATLLSPLLEQSLASDE